VFYLDKYEAAVAQIMKMGDKEREEMIAMKLLIVRRDM
jgi:hypothetical protein